MNASPGGRSSMHRRIGVMAAPPPPRFNEGDAITGVPIVYNAALVGMCSHARP
jgi:hypothetical protein